MNDVKFIGVTGFARSGKNLYCDVAKEILKKNDISSEIHSLAYSLKYDCNPFLLKHFNISAFTENTNEKIIIRPFLIWFGMEMRRKNNRVWIEKLSDRLRSVKTDVVFISDVRFSTNELDELGWLKDELNGKLVHVKKYIRLPMSDDRKYVGPASDDEEKNDPLMQQRADYFIDWEHIDIEYDLLKKDKRIVSVVESSLLTLGVLK